MSKAALLQEMMDEERSFAPSKRPVASSSSLMLTPPRSAAKKRKTDEPALKLHFEGRVYRGGSLSPSKVGGKRYAPPSELLGAPDEMVIDAACEATASSSRLQASPVLRKPVRETALSDPDSDLEIDRSSPFSSPSASRAAAAPSLDKALKSGIDPLSIELPPHYASYVNLHAALERALMVHLSTEGKGGRIASAVAQAFKSNDDSPLVSMPALITYHQLRPLIEQGGGYQFSEAHFARLVWLWADQTSASSPLSGLGFVVNKTLNRSRSSGQKVSSWGLGIELKIRRTSDPGLSLVGVEPPSPKRSRSAAENARDGMSVVALWSLGAEGRKEAVRRKLGLLVIAHQQDSKTSSLIQPSNGQLPTPPRSTHKRKHTEAMLGAAFDLDRIPEVPSVRLPILRATGDAQSANALLNEREQAAEATAHLARPSSSKVPVQERANSLLERIRAKEKAQAAASPELGRRQANLTLLSPGRKSLKSNNPAAQRERQRMQEFKRKSMLSRMPDVADAISMLFGQVACPPSPSGSSAVVRARRAVSMDEVCALVAKSSKIALSFHEASEAVRMLVELCPDFATIKKIDARDWLCAANKGMDLRACKETLKQELLRST